MLFGTYANAEIVNLASRLGKCTKYGETMSELRSPPTSACVICIDCFEAVWYTHRSPGAFAPLCEYSNFSPSRVYAVGLPPSEFTPEATGNKVALCSTMS